MTAKSATPWADLLRACTALRTVEFGGTVVAELFAAMVSDVTGLDCRLEHGRRRSDGAGRCSAGPPPPD